jgi:hypothetical protein
MANRVLFMGWNRPAVGREQQAVQLFQKSMEFWANLQADGLIESFEPVFLSSHGGDLNGFVILRGEAARLAEILENVTFMDLSVEAGYCLEGFGIVGGYIEYKFLIFCLTNIFLNDKLSNKRLLQKPQGISSPCDPESARGVSHTFGLRLRIGTAGFQVRRREDRAWSDFPPVRRTRSD